MQIEMYTISMIVYFLMWIGRLENTELWLSCCVGVVRGLITFSNSRKILIQPKDLFIALFDSFVENSIVEHRKIGGRSCTIRSSVI